jgi:hypothetical protein
VRPDGWPQTTIVGYANDGWRLYFLINRTSQKFQNIRLDNRVSISVGREPGELHEIKAVYAGCYAREVIDSKEGSRAWQFLCKRHPNLTGLAPSAEDVALMVAECRYVSVVDYSQGIGHTESFNLGAR